jgi:hypothetical protein
MHKLKLTIKDGITHLIKVELDDKPFLGATRIRFDTGENIHGIVLVMMEFHADIEIEGTADVQLKPMEVALS